MIPASVGFLAGTLLVQHLPYLPPASLLVTGWIITGLTGLWIYWQHRAAFPPGCRVVLWLMVGALWAMSFAAIRLGQGLPASNLRYDALVQGEITSIPEALDRGQRFEYRIHRVLSPDSLNPRYVRLSWYDAPTPLKAGEHWQFRVKLKSPQGSLNPGGMDYEAWLFAEGIDALGYVSPSRENQRLGPGGSMAGWRQALYDRLQAALLARPYAGIIEALVMGIESSISQSQWDVLRLTGTTHLIAISGSHISLIAGLGFFLARWLAALLGISSVSPERIAAVFAIIVAAWYAALADFAIPTRRALVMVGVVMGAVFLKRNVSSLPVLALAALAVSLHDPLASLSPGFWLSFAAVGLILYGLSGRLVVRQGIRGLLRVNGLTALGLAPLLLLFFQQVSLISPLANAVAVPVLGILLVPVCLAGAVLLFVQPAWGNGLLRAAEYTLSKFWNLLEALASLPLAQWNHPAATLPELILALLGVVVWLAPRGIPGRWLGLVLCLPLIVNRPALMPDGHFRLSLLDVGQGLSAVVETRHHLLVFDTGARFSARFDMGRAVVEPYLRHRGWNRIDVLMISHGDNDHIGGAQSLLHRLPVARVYSSVPERLPGASARACQAGQGWDWDGIRMDVLAPVTLLEQENDNSCVVKITGATRSVLLTGDIEARAEQALIRQYGPALASTVLVVPHHGSKTSSTADFLDTVKPACALIPDGHLNRYGFPHPAVLARYRERNIPWFETADSGALTLDSTTPEPCAVSRYRQEHRRYWQARPGRYGR